MDIQDIEYIKYKKLVSGKNINPQTLLATDYLNHFNEIHMLIGMLADMPDCLEDIQEWKALTYQEHFKYSIFQDKGLAVEAYNHSPEKYKIPFENCVSKMDELLLNTISVVENALNENQTTELNFIVADYTPKMEKLIEKCSSIINGQETTTQQDVIDDYFGEDMADDNASDQNAIDDLFD